MTVNSCQMKAVYTDSTRTFLKVLQALASVVAMQVKLGVKLRIQMKSATSFCNIPVYLTMTMMKREN